MIEVNADEWILFGKHITNAVEKVGALVITRDGLSKRLPARSAVTGGLADRASQCKRQLARICILT